MQQCILSLSFRVSHYEGLIVLVSFSVRLLVPVVESHLIPDYVAQLAAE